MYGIKPKVVILVIVLGNVEQDGRRLKDDLAISLVINNDGNASIGVQLKEPRLLWQDSQGQREQRR
jgi:hypothetical protein